MDIKYIKKNWATLLLVVFGLCLTIVFMLPDPPIKEPINYVTLDLNDDIKINYYSFVDENNTYILYEQGVETITPKEIPANGLSWLVSLVDEGRPASQTDTYRYTYGLDNTELSKVLIPYSSIIEDAIPKTYSYGSSVKEGAFFVSSWATTYGVDCHGCGMNSDSTGGTSSGILVGLTKVRQSDGTWKDGITYDGYYIVAADKSIPLCTVLKISNHKFSGSGLVPGETFYAIVADRGGAIKGTDIDLFVGGEVNALAYNGKRSGLKVEIESFGKWTKNSLGQRMCRIQ